VAPSGPVRVRVADDRRLPASPVGHRAQRHGSPLSCISFETPRQPHGAQPRSGPPEQTGALARARYPSKPSAACSACSTPTMYVSSTSTPTPPPGTSGGGAIPPADSPSGA